MYHLLQALLNMEEDSVASFQAKQLDDGIVEASVVKINN